MPELLGKITQVAFMTRDIRASIEHFTRHLGIGPWFVIEGGSFAECRYRGQPSNAILTTAFANAHGMEFELMQLDNDVPSMWRDALEQDFRRETFHHWCIWPDDYDATLAAALLDGYAVYQDGATARGRFVYLEHPEEPDILELTERTPPRRAFQQLVSQAGRDWDGNDPIRTDWH
ncbi:VOC family protein [Corticibacterium sp. UT-5YL-CI-8]|nr:VOC family protein [Tianweitania sp. UT-5YL-CI-8]